MDGAVSDQKLELKQNALAHNDFIAVRLGSENTSVGLQTSKQMLAALKRKINPNMKPEDPL